MVATLLDGTLDLFGVPENWTSIAPFYLEAFDGVPADLVAAALRTARLNLKWFPKPMELRAPIMDEWSKRKTTAARLRNAAFLAERQSPPRQPATEEEALAALQTANAAIQALSKGSSNTGRRDTLPPLATPPCDAETLRRVHAETRKFRLPGEDNARVAEIMAEMDRAP